MYASKLKMLNETKMVNKYDRNKENKENKSVLILDDTQDDLKDTSENIKSEEISSNNLNTSQQPRSKFSDENIKKFNNNRPDNLDSKRKGLYINKPECLIIRDMNNLMKRLKAYREEPDNTMKDQISSTILDLDMINNNLIQNFNNNVWSIGDDLMEETTSPKLCHKYPNCSNCTSCWYVHLRKDEL